MSRLTNIIDRCRQNAEAMQRDCRVGLRPPRNDEGGEDCRVGLWPPRNDDKRRGAALLTVLIALMIITLILFEFQYASMVERKMAYNELDQLQAYYLAKSGARIGTLRVVLYSRAQGDPNLKNLEKQGINLGPYLNMIWQLPFPPFPPSEEAIASLDFMKEKNAAENLLKQTFVQNGTFIHTIGTEASKINLNFLIDNRKDKSVGPNLSQPGSLLEYIGKLLFNRVETIFADSEDPYEEFGNVKPEEVVHNIMDWVNPGSMSYGGGDKDGYYLQQDPPYKAKRNRFYTVDELRLIKGINSNLFNKLRKNVTVYSYAGRININQAGNDILRAIYPDFTDEDLKQIEEHKNELGGEWTSAKQFVDYVVDTLGRSGFEDIYDKPKEYPFTTDSESFLVESSGIIRKSASTIQKNIRIALALTDGGQSGNVSEQIQTQEGVNEAECKKIAGFLWDKRPGLFGCKSKPTSQDQCQNYYTGTWRKKGSDYTCAIPQSGTHTITAKDQTAAKKANKLKVLYWLET